MKMIAEIIGGEQSLGILRISQCRVKVDHAVKHFVGPDPVVHLAIGRFPENRVRFFRV